MSLLLGKKHKNNKVIKTKELKEEKKLGEGSFGIVYLGTFRGNKVAIKKMKQLNSDDGDNKIKEFEKEVSMLDKFRSEYIIHFYGAVFDPNNMCIVTEFAQFGSLQDLIKEKKKPISMKLRIKMMIDAAKGILYLHSNGILHRDIKPDNILVVSIDDNENVNAKLTDFGTSRNINQMMTNMTFTKGIGTPVYMAPEVMNGEKYKTSSDVYSFAITMFECFGWCECYPKSEFKFRLNIAPFVTEGKRRPKPDNMTNEQYQLIEQCWSQEPKERLEVENVVEKLEELVGIKRKPKIISNSNEKETEQIEEWTGMKIGNIIFDSDVDNWKKGSSVFDQKILNKSNLIFLIEDEDDNKFGSYVNAKIDTYDWITDSKSFLFSLKSNGRLNGMLKFDIQDSRTSFCVDDKNHECLFSIGRGFCNYISVWKIKSKNQSYCQQDKNTYSGIKNPLCGKDHFKPKRITVIQLIHNNEYSKEMNRDYERESEDINTMESSNQISYEDLGITKTIENVRADVVNVKQPSKHKIWNKMKDGSSDSEDSKEFSEEDDLEVSDDDISACVEISKDEAIKKETTLKMQIAEGIKEEMEEFEQRLEEAQRNSIFEFKVNKIAFIDNEKREKYKKAKSKCSNVQSKVVFHGSNIDSCSNIKCGDFRMSKIAKYGVGIYFTDSLDYSRYYLNEDKICQIPHIGDCHTFVQTEIYYDSSKEKHIYDNQYYVNYDDWLEDNGMVDNQNNYEMFRKECELEGKTVEKDGIHCGIVNTNTAILNENESKTESIVFNEYVVYDENQYLPMSAVTVERSEYLIIWRDPNFIKGECEDNENYSEKYHNNLIVNKKFISAQSGCNVYYEPTTEEAIELIKRKKCNKIILISNIGDDLEGKSFVEEARKILGSNVIVFFNDSNQNHLNWIKDYPNALFSNKQEFFEEFISNYNETGLKSLKNEIEKHYNIQFKQFDDDFLRYPCFIGRGRYYSIKSIDNNELLKQKPILTINSVLDSNEIEQIEKWTKMKIGNVIFDSDIDDWNQNTSVFDQKIINKSNLIFLIEDEDGNIFGSYVNAKIDRVGEWMEDSKSFLFSLRSNGRLNGVMKFDIVKSQSQFAFRLYKESDNRLFTTGNGDICIFKENRKKDSQCEQKSFNYDGIQNAFCGKPYPQSFAIKRIFAFQFHIVKSIYQLLLNDAVKREKKIVPIDSQVFEQIENIIGNDERIEDYLFEFINNNFVQFAQEKQKEKP